MNTLYRMRKFSNGKMVAQAYFVSLEAAEYWVEHHRTEGFTYEVAAVQPKELVKVS